MAAPLRARSRDESSERTRGRILRAAERLLARHGEGGFSIRALCQRAGVTAPTVYHHFGDKPGLVDRVVSDCFAAFDRSFEDASRPRDPVAALSWMFDRYVDYALAHPAHYRLMFGEAPARRTPAGEESYARLGRSVAAVATTGRLRVPVAEATQAFWASVHGVTSLILAGFFERDTPARRLLREGVMERVIESAANLRSPSHPERGDPHGTTLPGPSLPAE